MHHWNSNWNWSLLLGTRITYFISVELYMKNNVSILSFLVDSLPSWCSENSSALSMTCPDMVGILQPCLRECDSRRMYLILKSPPNETVMSFWVFILDKESRSVGGRITLRELIYSLHVILQSVSNSILCVPVVAKGSEYSSAAIV